MYGGVVKFNALTDTDGTCAQNDNLLLVGETRSVFTAVGRVEVGDVCAGVAGINHLECGEQVQFLALVVNFQFGAAPQASDELIAEAHLLCCCQNFIVLAYTQLVFHVDDVLDSFQEVGCDHGDLVDLFQRNAVVDQLSNGEDVVGAEFGDVFQQFFHAHVVELGQVQVVCADF